MGGLSLLNAVAGAASERLPLIVITGVRREGRREEMGKVLAAQSDPLPTGTSSVLRRGLGLSDSRATHPPPRLGARSKVGRSCKKAHLVYIPPPRPLSQGPNSNDWGTNRILHHTIGADDFDQESKAFAPFCAKTVRIHTLEDAHWQLDDGIATALRESR